MVFPLTHRCFDSFVLGDEHPDEHSVLADAFEVLTRERALPFAAADTIGAGDVDEVVPAVVVAIADGHFVIAARRGADKNRLAEGEQVAGHFRRGCGSRRATEGTGGHST